MHFCRAMSGAKNTAAKSQDPLCDSAATPTFSRLWKNVSKFSHGKTPENKKVHTSTGNASPRFGDFQSPKRPGLTAGSNSDSPGDVEPSQDIYWDSTSPTHSAGYKCIKVEISELVNRIAPKDIKPQKSTLLQWIGDSAVPCTPDIPKQRIRKRSSRAKSVEDLMKLARQFDENMQQDKDMTDNLNIINNNISINPVDPKQVQPALSCDSEEAELRNLFDCSTQKVSGPLSQGSISSACSEGVARPLLMPSSLKAAKAEDVASSHKASHLNKCDDFDDDWDWNDELLSDSLLMAITPVQQSAVTKTSLQSNTKSNANVNSLKISNVHMKSSYSVLQALCPKPKTTNRSTFKLGPEPVICPQTDSPDQPHESTFTAVQSCSKTEPAVSADNFSDSLWDDGDDALLYQVCDNVERISNSQAQKVNKPHCQDMVNMSINQRHKTTTPVPILANNMSTNKQTAPFVRSNSLPITSTSLNYQGWDKPMTSTTIKPQVSQSFTGNHVAGGSFTHINHNSDTSKSIQKSSHTAFKRNVSDSAVICNKVFVTSENTGKCSAAEIEKKKQEALARRRQRVQNSQKT